MGASLCTGPTAPGGSPPTPDDQPPHVPRSPRNGAELSSPRPPPPRTPRPPSREPRPTLFPRPPGRPPNPHPRSRAPFPPTTTEGRREGAPTGSVAPSGQGGTHDSGKGRARGRENRADSRRRRGWGAGVGESPEARRAGVGRCLATARQAQSSGRRPAEANRSRASGGTRRAGKRPSDGEPPAVTPHSPQDATGGSALCGLRLGGRQPWPAPRARRPRWGGGALSTSHHHPPPHPTPRTQPRGNLAGRSGGRGTPETPPPGAGQGWRGRPAEDGGAGGKAEESRLSQPTRTLHAAPPHSLPRGPSSQAAFPPLPSKSGQVNDPSPGSTMENLSADLSIIQG